MAQEHREDAATSYGGLKVPIAFAKHDETAEAETVVHLEEWKRKAYEVLSRLREDLRARGPVDADAQAEIVYYLSPFAGDGPWVLERSRNVALDILNAYVISSTDLQEQVLRGFIKPIFQPNPHPSVNIETGRKLPRPAGGPLGHLDYMEGQEWKNHPEVSHVISWCLSHTDTRSVEKLWHLFVPPIMTMLDDYDAKYKLRGVQLVSQLLEVSPPDLLRRTGIDTLILSSLKTCLTFLQHRETPDLIRATVPTSVRLTELTTADGSETRFDQLCALLGDCILANIWLYASRELDALQASVDAIPILVRTLGVGTSRYLKGLIPQLVFPLIPSPDNGASVEYKLSSLQALLAVVEVSAPRIPKWRGTILEAILKCWVDIPSNATAEETIQLKDHCRAVCAVLWTVCQSVAEAVHGDYERILSLNPKLFGPLLQLP
ncbi:hypothetical protein DICSQDRAFT_103604 [Dichomitus squalens LYAD-421 SS1]|uniref:uncharacterized protein n=1 Tax=Dichomitus squalens (strain LYAD-421) TaxID=732165 RepID=UPI00044127E7|nr:uncharacterized protein DICSQDRAFT_103604 [Dichomitus squalens LYAD-421 SS1]EJF63083.1 hypothetical protein DICSQDRAFT_103604 [Dichomitus squalens LYAD-421 SS1]